MTDLLARITHDPAVMGGRPCLRVTVGTIVGLLAAGRSVEEIPAAYPYLRAWPCRQRHATTHLRSGTGCDYGKPQRRAIPWAV